MDKEVLETIAKYKDRLTRLGVRPQRVIVFGSHASGEARDDSDLDLLIVSTDFEGMGLWDRLTLLGRARVDINRPMEILAATPAEIESDEVSLFVKHEVLAKGISAG